MCTISLSPSYHPPFFIPLSPLSSLYEIFIYCDYHCILFLCRFKVPLNEDMSSFSSLMWMAVVGGASIAMVSLLMNHGGSPFITSNSASSLKYLSPKSRFARKMACLLACTACLIIIVNIVS